jgi:hypothetical protein
MADDIRRRLTEQPIQITEDTARRLIDTLDRRASALAPVQRLRSSQIISAVLGSIGLALFIVGVENAASDIPVISNAWGSIGVGLLLLLPTGALLTRLGGHFESADAEPATTAATDDRSGGQTGRPTD